MLIFKSVLTKFCFTLNVSLHYPYLVHSQSLAPLISLSPFQTFKNLFLPIISLYISIYNKVPILGDAPLYDAIAGDQVESTKLLIKYGANLDIKNVRGKIMTVLQTHLSLTPMLIHIQDSPLSILLHFGLKLTRQ